MFRMELSEGAASHRRAQLYRHLSLFQRNEFYMQLEQFMKINSHCGMIALRSISELYFQTIFSTLGELRSQSS